MDKPTLVAVVQLNCKSNKEDNFNRASGFIRDAARSGARIAFLPECFDMVCESQPETLQKMEPITGPLITKYKELAVSSKIWLSLGGFHEKVEGEEKARNAHIIINDAGHIVSLYRKIHLFNLEIPGSVRLIESEFSTAGDRLIPPCETPAGRIGLGICYDVRFPEMAIALAKSGADILTYPSAFTVPTGMDHWVTLLRCRAIENQCYVIAAAQTGQHNHKRASFGHSLVVDPWGAVIAQCSEGEGYALALIRPEVITKSRSKLPIWTDRRSDIYGEVITPASNDVTHSIDSLPSYTFGSVSVQSYQVFYKSANTFAFVNHRPVLPGHVLVAPLRSSATRLSDLTRNELLDFFTAVQKVQSVIESAHEAKSATIAIQDGEEAGRSIEHLHAHILPRKSTDFGGNVNQIYNELQQHDKETPGHKMARLQTPEEMTAQSNRLRALFRSNL
jgi:predicted amidohydrolase/diadenosine tetraphosphate (Ap4A) HIT family hydrolase